jgi:hypothetical protein
MCAVVTSGIYSTYSFFSFLLFIRDQMQTVIHPATVNVANGQNLSGETQLKLEFENIGFGKELT